MDPRIADYLVEQALTPNVHAVVPLTGDASDRRYFRVLQKDGGSCVLALHSGAIDVEKMPFVSIGRLMREIPLPVPSVLHHSNELGVLGLDDLGDVTLQAHLGAASPAEHAALYRQAVAFIVMLQQRGAALASPTYPAYDIAFDEEKLTWELEFFVKHYLVAYRGASLDEDTREALRQAWTDIVRELASEPRVLCHRDYHSRNLMLHRGGLFIIDYQDARMGPDTYDLASLLRDSYLDMAPEQVNELIAHFLHLTRGGDPGDAEAREFRRRFDLMALQRNLKALGTFGYQTTTRNNTVYLQYIPRTLNYVRANLAAYDRFAPLRELLSGVVTELR
jgi:N-acetylmuramate 1-kinase